jgi:hypothetical protein
MKLRPELLLLPALHACIASADSTGLHTLAVSAETPAVAVAPQPRERHFFDLPSLDYVFQVEARCRNDWKPESMSLNVADSRVSRTGAELQDNAEQQVRLQIPAEQIAPIAMRSFCVIDETEQGSAIDAEPRSSPGAGNPPRITVSAALSAQASLRCSNGAELQMIYVTEPLDVTLTCEQPQPAAGVPGAAHGL